MRSSKVFQFILNLYYLKVFYGFFLVSMLRLFGIDTSKSNDWKLAELYGKPLCLLLSRLP